MTDLVPLREEVQKKILEYDALYCKKTVFNEQIEDIDQKIMTAELKAMRSLLWLIYVDASETGRYGEFFMEPLRALMGRRYKGEGVE